MGFLDKLRGTSDIHLSVATDPTEVGPGGQVTVRFDLGGELDDKVRSVRVGIEGAAKYLVEERDRDSDGDVRTRQVWRSYELFEEEHHYPPQIGPGQATITLPADAPPASPGAVEWTAFARVDRERAMDKAERVPLAVRVGADAVPTQRAPQRTDDGLTLDDLPVAVRGGERLSGHLTVNVVDDVKVTATRIRLHRRCTYVADRLNDSSLFGGDTLSIALFSGGRSKIVRDEKVAELDLSGKREFQPGSVEQLPFSIDVPGEAGPTTAHQHARVEWRVEAVLDRRLRGDLSVEVPIVVY